jgi:signal transduction histidine kinase
MRGYIEKHTTRFSLICEDRLPPVRGNASRLQQVVVNLVQNACHSLRSTSSAVEVATSTADEGRCVRLCVRDEGVGIAEHDLSHVLDPFFTTRRTSGGMGLGLPVTRSIVEDHHGTLDIESKEGVGTTVTVVLPAQPRNRDFDPLR